MVKIIRANQTQHQPESQEQSQFSSPQQQPQLPQPKQRGVIEELGRKTLGPILGAVKNLTNINIPAAFGHGPEPFESGSNYKPKPVNISKEFVQPAIKAAGLEELSTPETATERILHSTATTLPLTTFLGAAPFGQKLALDLLQSGVIEGLDQGKASTATKIGATLLTGLGFNKATSAAKKLFGIAETPEKLLDLAKQAEKSYYDSSSKLAEKIKVPSKRFEGSINKIYDDIKSNVGFHDISKKKNMLDKARSIAKDLEGGTFSPLIIEKRNKELNKLYSKVYDEDSLTYIKKLQNALFKEAEEIGKTHKDWYSTWNKAKDIRKAINFGPDLKGILENVPSVGKVLTNPIAQKLFGYSTLGAASLYSAPLAVGAGIGYKAYEQGRMIAGFAKNPSTHNLLVKASKNLAERNIPALTKTLTQINQSAKSYENKNKSKPEPLSSRIKIIRANQNGQDESTRT